MRETRHRIVTADAADLSFLPDSSVALVVTSPPYPMIRMWDAFFSERNPAVAEALARADGERAFELMHAELDRAWAECFRVLAPGGWACVNIGDAVRTLGGRFRMYPNHARVLLCFSSLGFDVLPAVLWRKQTNAPTKFMGSGMLPGGAYVTLEHEHVLIMRKGPKRPPGSAREKGARRRSAFFWEERNRWFSDVWDFKGTRQDLGHPELRARSAAFPFELPYRLVCMYSSQGDTVLDPFVGTGTTILAAMAGGRNSVGVDVDPALVSMIVEEAPAARDFLNGVVEERVAAHLRFIHRRESQGGKLAYVNKYHGFRVMTAQESDLVFELIEEIQRCPDGSFSVSYRDFKTGDGGTPPAIPDAEGARPRE